MEKIGRLRLGIFELEQRTPVVPAATSFHAFFFLQRSDSATQNHSAGPARASAADVFQADVFQVRPPPSQLHTQIIVVAQVPLSAASPLSRPGRDGEVEGR